MVTIDYNIIIIITNTIARFWNYAWTSCECYWCCFMTNRKRNRKWRWRLLQRYYHRVCSPTCTMRFFFILHYFIITAIDRRDKYLIRFIALSPDAIAECCLADRTRIYQPKLIPDRFENFKNNNYYWTILPFAELRRIGTYDVLLYISWTILVADWYRRNRYNYRVERFIGRPSTSVRKQYRNI